MANPGSPGKMAVKTECVCVCFTGKYTPSIRNSNRALLSIVARIDYILYITAGKVM